MDITNFVLHEYGQALHAFDADKIKGNHIVVRNCAEGTPFVTLDGIERKLSSADLMICNEAEPMCIAGVFGGLDSGVTEQTKNIFIESAYFQPVSIRKTARRHQLQTDAGSVNMTMAIDEKRHFNGHIDTKEFSLKKVLDDEQFGTLSTDIDLSGQLPDGQPLIVKADGIVHQFEFKGYNYQHIDIDGLYSPTDIHGHASIDDANIGLVVDGSILQRGKQHNVKLEATFANLSPKAINLTDQWDEARFFGDIKADFLASDLNDAVGTIDVNEFSMQGHNTSYDLDELHIESGYDGDIHYVTMTSDFGEG